MTLPMLIVTGAAGAVATQLRPLLREHYRLRLVDRQEPANATDDEIIVGDLLDPEFARSSVRGADAVLHLAGNPNTRADWASLEPANVRMTELLLAAASDAGVRRFVFASSIHAAGAYVQDGAVPVDPAWPPRPCCRYGASKVAAETLGWVYAHNTALAVSCLRIALSVAQPDRPFAVPAWVSPRDLAQLVHCSVTADHEYGIYFAVSANTSSLWIIDNAKAELGYRPVDDASDWGEGPVAGNGAHTPRSWCFEGERSRLDRGAGA